MDRRRERRNGAVGRWRGRLDRSAYDRTHRLLALLSRRLSGGSRRDEPGGEGRPLAAGNGTGTRPDSSPHRHRLSSRALLLLLLVQGQYVVPLVSDPFGFGRNL